MTDRKVGPKARALGSPAAFFARLRPLFGGSIRQAQVAGMECKLVAFGLAGAPIAYVAYGLATSFWETAQTMQPVEEIGRGKSRPYGKAGKHKGQIAYGRGDVQLTWDFNYSKADYELELGGKLINDYSLALRPDISARMMVEGMLEGWFTGKRLADYLPATGCATSAQFQAARRIINGVDRAAQIAAYAGVFQDALADGRWAPVPEQPLPDASVATSLPAKPTASPSAPTSADRLPSA